ncbi:Ankyrin repeat and SOCS box protein 13 [Takifugu flavidus]|uniref:Ankyrin repeat and SOCS box protein 13 n=1 Tax=Takifugu flavidus TaxID=433684 RepID=A0A5C6NE71_9TELE|nr:Ankyrin repeat and SOCS box protein 13 [Takifugu flavidus]
MVFGPEPLRDRLDHMITLDGISLTSSHSVRNLGVTFDQNLSFNSHIKLVSRSAFFHLRNITRIRKLLTQHDAEKLVHAFVTSRLDYCNSLLSGCPNNSLRSLQLIQNAAARVLTGCWSERTEVHRAASQGHAAQLQDLIQSGASVNMVAVDSITPLHEACVRGQAECVQLLLEAGAQVDARNVDGSTPLCDACSAGSLECVKLLLEHGAKANTALTSRTASPLHEACMGGNADCVKLLIAVDAGLEAYDLYYGTPLHVACANDDINCVKVLLNAGESRRDDTCPKMSNSCILTFDLTFAPTPGAKVNAARLHETPLHHAAKNMRVEMIEILVEFGANVYARDQHNRKPVYYTTPGSPSAGCLSFYENIPMSLQQLCRLALRNWLGPRALKVIGQLQIPKLLIRYLCYQ